MVVINRVPKSLQETQSLEQAQAAAAIWIEENAGFLGEVLKLHKTLLVDKKVDIYQQTYDGYLESIELRDKSRGDGINHKIQATLGGLLIDFVVDYLLGKAIVWSFEDKADNGSPNQAKQTLMDDYRREILDILETEEGQRVLREMLTQGSVAGYWSAIAWLEKIGENKAKIDFEDFPIQEMIPVFDSRGRLKMVVRAYEEDELDVSGLSTGATRTRIEVYDERFVVYGYRSGNSETFVLDNLEKDEIPVYEHGAAQIPVAVFTNGSPATYEDRRKRAGVSDFSGGIFDLIEAYAHSISDKANLSDRLQDAFLVLTGVDLGATAEEAEGEVMAMRNARALALRDKESAAQYIAPDQADGAVENYMDRIRDTIHEKGFIPKLSDLSGATATEIKVKYAGTDIKAGKKEVYFTGAIKKLLSILTDFINSRRLIEAGTSADQIFEMLRGDIAPKSGIELYQSEWVSFTLNRNLPQNYLEISQIVQQLAGIVPDSYLYELLWFIPDPQAALDEMKKQKEDSAARSTAALFPAGFASTSVSSEQQPGGTGQENTAPEGTTTNTPNTAGNQTPLSTG